MEEVDLQATNEHMQPGQKDWVNHNAVNRMKLWSCAPFRCASSVIGVRLNPVTSIATTVIIWVFIVICLTDTKDPTTNKYPALDGIKGAQSWITDVFTWLYIGTEQCWFVFIIVVYFSKYGSLKLGKDDDKPEYDTGTWFMMLFAAGVGVGLFYFGVAEPVWHYSGAAGRNRHSHEIEDERAQQAMNITWYHWGVHGWIVFCIVGLTMGLLGFRKGLPVTMRSCFYPLLGDKTFGPIGDAIDVLSAVCTTFGVCCSLGLGVMDLVSGLTRVTGCGSALSIETCQNATENRCAWVYDVCKHVCDNAPSCGTNAFCDTKTRTTLNATKSCSITEAGQVALVSDQTSSHYILLIWIITIIASTSVVTGMKLGVRSLSILCFSLGMFIWVIIFNAGSPWFYLDLFTQQIGLYLQTLVSIGTHTDVYARHTESSENEGASPSWMDAWTMFYWGWWISWAPFVGMFIAKISKGRTVREFINGTLTAPSLYAFVWFTVFGGDGIRMERAAEKIGLTGGDSPAKFNSFAIRNVTNMSGLIATNKTQPSFTCGDVTTNCTYYSHLSGRDKGDMWMDMVSQHYDLGPFLMVCSLVGIVLYFVTSADSGSLVIDALCSNGLDDTPAIQKVYWAATQGATATALIIVGFANDGGAKDVIEALRAASIVSGLPYTIMMCFMCASLWKTCKYEYGDDTWSAERFFRADLLNVFDIRATKEWLHVVGRTLVATVVPWLYLRTPLIHGKFKSTRTKMTILVGMMVTFYLVPLFLILEAAFHGAAYFAFWWYMLFATLLAVLRAHMRSLKNLDGDFIQDFFACLCLYPMVVEQLDAHFRVEGADKLDPNDDSVKGFGKAETVTSSTESVTL